MKKITLFDRTLLGLKKGWLHPTLPTNLLKLELHSFIKKFRLLCIISVLIILTKAYEKFNINVLYILILLSGLFVIYKTYLNYYRIKHIYNSIKKGELNVRNSPIDRLASLFSKLIFCFKRLLSSSSWKWFSLKYFYSYRHCNFNIKLSQSLLIYYKNQNNLSPIYDSASRVILFIFLNDLIFKY